MTNTFSIEVSKALRAIGVEGETSFYWLSPEDSTQWPPRLGYKTNLGAYFPNGAGINKDTFNLSPVKFPAYTLHDILRLMPKIGEKMGRALLDAFLEKDYAGAENCLMSIITKDHGK